MNWHEIPSEDRGAFADVTWSMYVTSYQSIGLIASGPAQLLAEYDRWWILLDEAGNPRAFRVAKTTPFGSKLGLSGTDGSREAKRTLVQSVGSWFDVPGFYAEVSHRMEEIAAAANAPVVCALDARAVLGKPVDFVGAVHYSRPIAGVGPVVKVMVGNPVGVATTSYVQPACAKPPMVERTDLSEFADVTGDMVADRLDDDASLAPWLDL